MLTQSSYERLSRLVPSYPHEDLREDTVQDIALRLCQGMRLRPAFIAATRHARNQQRYARGESSLDELYEAFSDALHMYAIESRIQSPLHRALTRANDNRKAHSKATPRELERSIEVLGLDDGIIFQSVLKNLYQRGYLSEVGDLALDIELQSSRKAGLLRLILSSATKEELRERGYKTGEIKGATHWLTQYYATPPSR